MRELFVWIRRHEQRLATGALVVGFVFDYITLRRVDFLIENLIFTGYLSIAFLAIFFLHKTKDLKTEIIVRFQTIFALVLQFAFGALFSGFLVFYSRSASFEHSWPFLLIIALVLVMNEFLKRYRARLTYEMTLFFFALLSYSIFLIPVLVRALGTWVFLLSGAVSIVLLAGFSYVLFLAHRTAFLASMCAMIISCGLVFCSLQILYFTNLIPPIPLSFADGGVYHHIVREGNAYRVTREELTWRDKFLPDAIHLVPGNPLFIFSAVFAPTKLDTTIVHRWKYFNEETKRWQTEQTISFPISGGREQGYRGYSQKSVLREGKWKVSVETGSGQVIGEVRFKVVYVEKPPRVVTETK